MTCKLYGRLNSERNSWLIGTFPNPEAVQKWIDRQLVQDWNTHCKLICIIPFEKYIVEPDYTYSIE